MLLIHIYQVCWSRNNELKEGQLHVISTRLAVTLHATSYNLMVYSKFSA